MIDSPIPSTQPADLRLEDLVAGITAENLHDEIAIGEPVGDEAM